MGGLKIIVILILSSGAFSAHFISADVKNVVINEIAWMGTEEQWQNEWIELYNPSGLTIKLDGWVLKTKDNSPEIKLSGTIQANSYFLLERTDDGTLPDIPSDQIYKGGLNNQGEHLMLLNNSGKIIDEIDCALGWFGGDNETKKTMERLNPLLAGSDLNNWKMSQKSGGTPKAKNSPQEKTKGEKEIETISAGSSGSNFSFILGVGLAISMLFSMLVLAFWLKIKQKKDKIKMY